MAETFGKTWFAFIAAFALCAALTFAVRAIARAYGIVAAPKADRWHKHSTAMLGGVGIAPAVLVVTFGFVSLSLPLLAVCGASAWLFAVGLIDDFLHIKPYQKLIGQIIGAVIVIACGLVLPWTVSAPLNMLLTLFWLIGITNAINLLDNMDGLAAGVAAIAAIFLGWHFLALGQANEALLIGIFAASLLGFLIYNSSPATIFMGDCGSMFVGFFLASASLLTAHGATGRSRSFLPVLAVPVLTLLIPIFDTTLVTIARKLAGRAASQGGRDHLSHRLVALGLSERRAVGLLYALACLAGFVALLVRDTEVDTGVAVLIGLIVVLTLAGIYLARVKVYDEAEIRIARERQPLVSFLVDLSYKRRVFEVLLDIVLISLAYYSAYTLFYGSLVNREARELFISTLPVIVSIKLTTLLATGVYRGLWRYTSVDDLIVIAKAVVASSIASILTILFAFRFEGFSRTIFALDAVLLLLFICASRGAFRIVRQMLPHASMATGKRVLIYGADDAGALLLRETRRNQLLQIAPVGFLDDDVAKRGKKLLGLPVFYRNGDLRFLCREQKIAEIIVANRELTAESLTSFARDCRYADVALKRMRIEFEVVDE